MEFKDPIILYNSIFFFDTRKRHGKEQEAREERHSLHTKSNQRSKSEFILDDWVNGSCLKATLKRQKHKEHIIHGDGGREKSPRSIRPAAAKTLTPPTTGDCGRVEHPLLC